MPGGYIETVGTAGYTITGTSGTNQTGLNFENFKLFSVSGTKFTDITGNGASSDDTGLGGITIFIDKDGNSSLSAGDLSTVKAGNGNVWIPGTDLNRMPTSTLE